MKRQMRAALCSSVALAAMAASVPVIAQEITSIIRGAVTTPAGAPASGLAVTVTDTRTGSTQTATTNSNGAFSVRGLTVGGPYTIRVAGGQYEDYLITDVFTQLGSGAQTFNIALQDAQAGIEEISVVASAASVTNVAIGPSSSFNLQDIQNLPSISRQVRDIIRIDPRVNIGRSSGGEGSGINCAGSSNRVNSFTIDGIRAADPFGLNPSGNLARSTFPIPFDAMGATSVEFSPVDVEYGQFTGCNVNVVTKSGTNEFHGSAFFLYNNDALTGTDIEGQLPVDADFNRYNWGADLGGPIIKDKLFFYFAYEETDTADVQEPEGFREAANDGSTDDFFTRAELNDIRDILIGQYGRDPGTDVTSMPNTSVRYFGRIDWQINDDHRLEATYGRLEEDRLLGDDIGTGRGQYTFSDNFQQRGSVSDTYSVRFFSNWSDNFSTEIRASRNEVTDVQSPSGGGEAQDENPIPRIVVGPFGNEFFGQNFASGPGVFRSANQLDTKIDQIKARGTYILGDHEITFGYELDKLDVFNLFIPNGTGTIFFDDIDALRNGTARDVRIGASFSGDPRDAAAEFSRSIHTLYLQDEWQVTSDFTLTAGLRYDFYKSSDQPLTNPSFNTRYGFDNTQAFDGLDALQPRIGFTWQLPDSFGDTSLTGGFATFSGGDPTVWFANAFQNFGGALGIGTGSSCTEAELNVLSGGSFSGLPQCAIAAAQAQAQQFGGAVAAVDPNLKMATQNRFSVGVTHFTDSGIGFFDDWQIKLDVIYSDIVNAFDFVDVSLTPVGTAPDGRPIFEQVDPTQAGCNATFNGIRDGFSNVTPECVRGYEAGDTFADLRPDSDFQDIILTNAVNGGGHQLSIAAQFQKQFEVSSTGTIDFRAGYAYSDAQIGNQGNSSTAGSNFEEVTTSNFNNVPLGTSGYNNTHNITVGLTYSEQFFGDNVTSITAFFRARSGRPLSYVFDDSSSNRIFGDSDSEARSLLYIPTGVDDPLVNFGADFDTTGFFNYLADNDLDQYAGQIIDRTTNEQPWTADIDLRFQQEIPGPGLFDDDKFLVFIDFENVLNFFDSGAGKQRFFRSGDVSEGISLVEASGRVDAAGVLNGYNFNEFTPPREIVDFDDTLWRINLGVRYRF